MKNKVIIVVVVVLCLVAAIALGYILINQTQNPSNQVQNGVSNTIENEVPSEEETPSNTGENVAINSKRGIEILEPLNFVTTIYSNMYYDEIDSNGFSNKAKVIASFIKLSTQEAYQSLILQGDQGSYFSKNDLEDIAKTTFANTSKLENIPIDGLLSYDASLETYTILARGFSNLDYALEVPYQITEYDDKVEVKSYRIYINSEVKEEEANFSVIDSIYYDRAMQKQALSFENGELSNNANAVAFIREKIENKELEEKELTSVQYTLLKSEDGFLLSDYKKGK